MKFTSTAILVLSLATLSNASCGTPGFPECTKRRVRKSELSDTPTCTTCTPTQDKTGYTCQTIIDNSTCNPFCSVLKDVQDAPCVLGFGTETDKRLKVDCRQKFKPFMEDSGVCLPKCKKREQPLTITGESTVDGIRYTNFTTFDQCQ